MAGQDPQFCENYLVLKPEEASCLDFARIFCCKDLGNRVFYNTGAQQSGFTDDFSHRWIVFVSMFLQKVFLLVKKPVAVFGYVVEFCLNSPAFNDGFCFMLLKLFTGKFSRPNRASKKFTSIVGYVDKRLDLDMSFTKTENVAIMASKLSYENSSFVRNVVDDHWQMKFLEFYDFWDDFQESKINQAMMFQDKTSDPTLITVAFRGTELFNTDDWSTDIDISWYEFKGVGKIHGGFMKALGLQKSTGWPNQIPNDDHKPYAYYTLRAKLQTLIHQNPNAKFILTGHSLGGALAVLFAAVLAIHNEERLLDRLEGIYTFGQPRIGDHQFGEYMKNKFRVFKVRYYRYVYCNDLVPRLPYDDRFFLFKHFGTCLYFNRHYKGQVMEEEPNKNYFSPIYAIPKMFNSVCELIRAIVLPWTKGDDYKEEWIMLIIRVIGLVFPGFSNHMPVDYVNVTLLGDWPLTIRINDWSK